MYSGERLTFEKNKGYWRERTEEAVSTENNLLMNSLDIQFRWPKFCFNWTSVHPIQLAVCLYCVWATIFWHLTLDHICFYSLRVTVKTLTVVMGIEPSPSDNTDIGRPVTWSRLHDLFIVSRNSKNLPSTAFVYFSNLYLSSCHKRWWFIMISKKCTW